MKSIDSNIRMVKSVLLLLLAGAMFVWGCPSNHPPNVFIQQPEDGTVYPEGESVTMLAKAMDPEDDPMAKQQVVWKSNKDGQIGTGFTIRADSLTTGDHVISVTATDSKGVSNSHSIRIHIITKEPGY